MATVPEPDCKYRVSEVLHKHKFNLSECNFLTMSRTPDLKLATFDKVSSFGERIFMSMYLGSGYENKRK